MCEATYMYLCRVISVNNKLFASRKCDISVCRADIFKPRDYLVRGKSVFSYCGIILLTRRDYTFSRRATFSPDAFINNKSRDMLFPRKHNRMLVKIARTWEGLPHKCRGVEWKSSRNAA